MYFCCIGTDSWSPSHIESSVGLIPYDRWPRGMQKSDLVERLSRRLRRIPGIVVGFSQPMIDGVNDKIAGAHSDLVVKVFGEDLVRLKRVADQIGKTLRNVDGTGDLRVQRVLGLPLLEVKPDRARLARHGIPADDVLAVMEASRIGREAGTIYEGQKRFPLKLLIPPLEKTIEGIGSLPVGAAGDYPVPMASVADIRAAEGPAVINREALEQP